MKGIVGVLIGLCALAMATPAAAQGGDRVSITVGKISTTQTCTYFQESEGSAALIATRRALAAAASWRTWWVKDCVSNFATMRSTMESALAAAPGLSVGGKARYTTSLNITQVSDANAPTPTAPGGGDFGFAINYLRVSFDLTVRDSAGRSVFGTVMTKTIEIGSDVRGGGFRATSNEGGESAYGVLQNQVALAAARAVAFHFDPMQVVSRDGREVQLNYGSPYLMLGSLVMVSSPDRRATIRYRVISAGAGFATAAVDGDGDQSRIGPGSLATFVEADDPMANGRRFKTVDLP